MSLSRDVVEGWRNLVEKGVTTCRRTRDQAIKYRRHGRSKKGNLNHVDGVGLRAWAWLQEYPGAGGGARLGG